MRALADRVQRRYIEAREQETMQNRSSFGAGTRSPAAAAARPMLL
jgi:hypothetical protein